MRTVPHLTLHHSARCTCLVCTRKGCLMDLSPRVAFELEAIRELPTYTISRLNCTIPYRQRYRSARPFFFYFNDPLLFPRQSYLFQHNTDTCHLRQFTPLSTLDFLCPPGRACCCGNITFTSPTWPPAASVAPSSRACAVMPPTQTTPKTPIQARRRSSPPMPCSSSSSS